MKKLNPMTKTATEPIDITNLNQLSKIPIIYEKDGWTVYLDDNTYTCIYGYNERTYTCQTAEQVQFYIPEFEL